MANRPSRPTDAAIVAAFVEASCQAQGVALKIVYPLVLRKVAVLLGGGASDELGLTRRGEI